MQATPAILLSFSLALASPVAAQPTDAPPSTPANLTASVYSRTAGAIRWDRSTDDRGAVVGYEVVRDGAVIDVRDALSYVDFSLSPGTAYIYRVTAMDNAGQRSGTASVRLTTPGSGNLSAPTGLRADVYSATAAEIFWKRPALFGLTYEVRRDGELLVTTDGTSWFDDTLERGRSYTYEVIAIDRQGRRSVAASVSLETLPGAGQMMLGPAAPTGLRTAVYSRTAAELFWDRPDVLGLRYEVLRDNVSLGVIDGVSYFDDALAGGQSYRYDVIAIDRQGRRSTPSSVALSTYGSGGIPMLPVEPMALDMVANELIVAFAGYQADAKGDAHGFARLVVDSAIASRELPDSTTTFPNGVARLSQEVDVTATNTEYDCALGGQLAIGIAELELREIDYSRNGFAKTFRFNDCRFFTGNFGENVLNGYLALLDDNDSGRRFGTRTLFYEWSDFSLSLGGTTVLEIDGSTTVSDINTDPPYARRRTALGRYVETTVDGELVARLDDASFAHSWGREGPFSDYGLALSGTITSPATNGVAVAVETVTSFSHRYSFERELDGDPFTGELSFRAEDGRALTVTARDTQTFELFVDHRYTDAEGEIRETENVPFANLTIYGPNGRPPYPE